MVEKTSHCQTLSHNVVSSTPRLSGFEYIILGTAWSVFEHTMLVVIGTDCIGSYKSNYHTTKNKKIQRLLTD